jgi:hypothetical protein
VLRRDFHHGLLEGLLWVCAVLMAYARTCRTLIYCLHFVAENYLSLLTFQPLRRHNFSNPHAKSHAPMVSVICDWISVVRLG